MDGRRCAQSDCEAIRTIGMFGYACKVANTSSEAWKFKHVKRRTDRDDALRRSDEKVLFAPYAAK
jgi:hypothetical protein